MKKRDYVAPKYSNFEGIRTYILKVASRCNLNCSYCYMYNMGDDSYINQPKFIDMETVRQFAYRLKNHAKAYSLKTVSIAFHGGEPLLWGLKNIIEAKNIILNIISSAVNTDVQFAIQTNGVLLNENVIASLVQNNIYIGISLDGLKKTHDKYRIDFKKKGSFDAIIKNVHSLKKHQKYLSILTVMNLEIDPEEYYDFLIKLDVYNLNIIFLEANYVKLPDGYNSLLALEECLYGKWLAKLFDVWVKNIHKKRIAINIFEVILGLLSQHNVGDQMFGKGLNDVATIESNGAIETVDMLRITEKNFTRNHLNVFNNELSELIKEKEYQIYYYGHQNLCKTCNECEFVKICGGGLTVHRYNADKGFDNPSVYCNDLKHIISHINNFLLNFE